MRLLMKFSLAGPAVIQLDAACATIRTVPQTLTAIPYYAWANRGQGEMTIWFPAQVLDVDLVTCPAGRRKIRNTIIDCSQAADVEKFD